jgi:hypothetical protein
MSQITANAIAPTISADSLTEGDIIRHLGSNWQVLTEPRYTRQGIEFEVLWLDLEQDNTQEVSFDPRWRFELVTHQPQAQLEAA